MLKKILLAITLISTIGGIYSTLEGRYYGRYGRGYGRGYGWRGYRPYRGYGLGLGFGIGYGYPYSYGYGYPYYSYSGYVYPPSREIIIRRSVPAKKVIRRTIIRNS